MRCWRGHDEWPEWTRPAGPSRAERFWVKVDKTGDCWLWTAGMLPNGYGQFDHTTAHRVAYELAVGEIPAGFHVDHLCRVLTCVNPAHLEAVTPSENNRRGYAAPIAAARVIAASKARKTCKHGHAMTPENEYRSPGQPTWRVCRTCKRLREQKRRAAA